MQFSHSKRALVALLVLCIPLVLVGGAAGSATTDVPLGSAAPFALLAGTGISDVPSSAILGSVGVSPSSGSTIGLTCAEINGHTYSVDASGPLPCRETNAGVLTTATGNEITAFGIAAGRVPDTTLVAADNQLGGQVLVPGVYRFGHATTANLIGNVTLRGDASSVWIFQATSDLVTATSSTVTLAGGAQACHIYWQVSSQATLGGSSTLKGTVLAGTSILVGNGVHVAGRLFAQAAITLIADTVSRPSCASVSSPPPSGGSSPARELYCDPVTGQSYNLEVGQDKQPPYDKLNLVPATVDPVTGAKSCAIPAAVVTTTTTATTPTTSTSTATTTAPAPAKPAPRTHPAKKHAIAGAHVAKVVKRPTPRAARHVAPRPPAHPFGLTG